VKDALLGCVVLLTLGAMIVGWIVLASTAWEVGHTLGRALFP